MMIFLLILLAALLLLGLGVVGAVKIVIWIAVIVLVLNAVGYAVNQRGR